VYDVLYVCQFARPEQAEPSLEGQLNPVDDPYWHETGAVSPERYAEWAFTMCGMASALMALKYFGKNTKLVAQLAEDALKHGVYSEEDGELSAMKYREFVTWIQKHGLQAQIYTRLSVRGIQYALSRGRLVIISVNPNIRGYATAPTGQKGGHLVLVTGYDVGKNTITINNPSGFASSDTQVRHQILIKEFRRYYAGRGILLSNVS
jgi:uncharacterized protein YvpB